MKKTTKEMFAALIVGLIALTHTAQADAVFNFTDGNNFDNVGIGGFETATDGDNSIDVTLTTVDIGGFTDNTTTSAITFASGGSDNHRTNTGINALGVNSDGSGGYVSDEFANFNPGEVWIFEFDEDVTLINLDFSSFDEADTRFTFSSADFTTFTISPTDLSGNLYTFADDTVVSAGTDVQIEMSTVGAFDASNEARLDFLTVSVIPEPSSYALIGGLLVLAMGVFRRRVRK